MVRTEQRIASSAPLHAKLLSVDRNGSLWIACNLQLPSTAFLADLAIRQEQTAVY